MSHLKNTKEIGTTVSYCKLYFEKEFRFFNQEDILNYNFLFKYKGIYNWHFITFLFLVSFK